MALPVVSTPEFETEIPSSKKKIKFRPFLVKEEKLLYFALESKETNDIINSIKKIFENCILTDFKFDELAFFDFEYLFLMLRAKSVGESIELNLKHDIEGCGNINKVTVDIDDIKVQVNEEHSDKFMLDDNIGVKMRYPTIESISKLGEQDSFSLIRDSIEFVYDQENVYDEFSKEEMESFLDSLGKAHFEKIMEFFSTMPKLKHEVTYICKKCGAKETVVLEGLQSFFT